MRQFVICGVMLTAAICSLPFRVIAADGPLPVGRFKSRSLTLLARLPVRQELELNAAQIDELVRLELDRMELFRGPRGAQGQSPTLEEQRAGYAEYNRQLPEFEKRGLNVLLAHQRERLEQIVLQEAVRAYEPNGGVTHPQLASQLGLAEPQLETVRQAAIAAEKEFNLRMAELAGDIAKAKEAARGKVLAELTAEQRAAYEELIGEPFDLTARD